MEKRIGLMLGGGGEVGIAWEVGVLEALEALTAFRAKDMTVIAGTSAGAMVGVYAALDRRFADVAAGERAGEGFTTPFEADLTPTTDSAGATAAVPPDVLAALMSKDGSTEERARRIGALASGAPTRIDQLALVQAVADHLGTRAWPTTTFRPTAVAADSGETVLWDAPGEADLATAVTSSLAVPGFFPVITVGTRSYFDGPRTPVVPGLVDTYSLDAVIFIGLDLPVLSNSDERGALDLLAVSGIPSVAITGGDGVARIAQDLMSPSARPAAVEVGYEDGAASADAISALLG